eukprot:GHVN01034474.1.p1 GENE.GHVN01034474.1~~GHVN01034474.1.p1  ORF type:complete len:492 (+),score=22.21 GHVN01034474.1:48-1523(+)
MVPSTSEGQLGPAGSLPPLVVAAPVWDSGPPGPRIGELLDTALSKVLEETNAEAGGDVEPTDVSDQVTFSKRLAIYGRTLRAIINIQQLDLPTKRSARKDVPPDPDYPTHYKMWLDFLQYFAPAGETLSDRFGVDFLRSILLSNAYRIFTEMKAPLLQFDHNRFYVVICEICGITEETANSIVSIAREKHNYSQSNLEGQTGLGFLARDKGGAQEEDLGLLAYECITNDRQPEHLIKLITLKNIFSRQLPKMPREYIVRLVLDRNHFSFCLLKKGEVVGGVCFRPYFQQKFAEIAFLAVTSTEQVKGYGTRLMNNLKEHVKKAGIEYFMTYADNFATGYFRKQGFRDKLTLPPDRYQGFIKDYDGGTLMECYINPHIDYLRLTEMLQKQRERVRKAIQLVKPQKIFPGLKYWEDNPGASLDPTEIPGLVGAGWKAEPETKKRYCFRELFGIFHSVRETRPLKEQILGVLDVGVHLAFLCAFMRALLSYFIN